MTEQQYHESTVALIQGLPDASDTPNLSVWCRVEKTPVRFSKEFKQRGGFEGTAVNPHYLYRLATELFGPVGVGWGFEIVREEIINGLPLAVIHEIPVYERIHTLDVLFWYMQDGKRAEVPGRGHTLVTYKTKSGITTDSEYGKKSITDALSRAMAYIGFGADIRMGLYDSGEYVEMLEREDEMQTAEDREAVREKHEAEALDFYKRALEEFDQAKSARVLNKLHESLKKKAVILLNQEQIDAFERAYQKRVRSFASPKKPTEEKP